jgi:hypothetical protein
MEKSTEHLTELFERRLTQLQQFLHLTLAQREIVDTGETDELTGLLGKKQTLLEAMFELENSLSTYADDDPEERVWSSHDRRKHCQDVASECGRIFRDLKVLEQQAIDQLSSERDIARSNIRNHGTHQTIRTAYAAHESPGDAGAGLDISSG